MAIAEGLKDEAVLLQTFIGLGMAVGTLSFGIMVVSRSKNCLISRQYLLQTSIFGISLSILALCSLQGYHGYLLFVWMYGIFLGGFHYVLKVYTFERIRAKHFPRGWSFVQGARAFPILIGLPITGYINVNFTNKKAGYYLSFICVFLGGLVLFFMDWWKRRGRSHQSSKSYCDLRDSSKFMKDLPSTVAIEQENLSQKLSDVHGDSVVGGNSVILRSVQSLTSDSMALLIAILKVSKTQRLSIKITTSRESLSHWRSHFTRMKSMTMMVRKRNPEIVIFLNPGHSYHFRGKPELLACISEENLLVQLEIEYQGDITSCNKVENYLQYSEYEYENDGNSFNSSEVHSEQVKHSVARERL